jgi:hypothetical protein
MQSALIFHLFSEIQGLASKLLVSRNKGCAADDCRPGIQPGNQNWFWDYIIYPSLSWTAGGKNIQKHPKNRLTLYDGCHAFIQTVHGKSPF